MRFVIRAGGYRYLRITIDSSLPLNHAAALLGHELQHAVEVAEARWVVDAPSFEVLYRRIGESCRAGAGRFDTAAARRAGRAVLVEIQGERPVPAARVTFSRR